MWRIEPEWRGDIAIVLAGGTSALSQDLSLLRGHRVIAINSAWTTWPAADVLFWADAKWWQHFGALGFAGRKVTCSKYPARDTLQLKKVPPPGLATDPGKVTMKHTSLSGAIGVAVHLGVRAIVLLGADGKVGPGGRRHNHAAAYPWPLKPGCFDLHAAELRGLVEPLRKRGITVINASPGSAWDIWPIMNLCEALALLDGETNGESDRHVHSSG